MSLDGVEHILKQYHNVIWPNDFSKALIRFYKFKYLFEVHLCSTAGFTHDMNMKLRKMPGEKFSSNFYLQKCPVLFYKYIRLYCLY